MEHKLIKVIKAIILTENRITLHHAPKEKNMILIIVLKKCLMQYLNQNEQEML